MRVLLLVILLLLTNATLATDSALPACSSASSLTRFLSTDSNWKVVRQRGEFSPILGLKVLASKLWVSSYGSDFFPVTVRASKDSFVIENIRFRRPPPVSIPEDPAELVKPYTSEEVIFLISLAPDECEIEHELMLEVLNAAGEKKEILRFRKSKK